MSHDKALYKSTDTLLYFTTDVLSCAANLAQLWSPIDVITLTIWQLFVDWLRDVRVDSVGWGLKIAIVY